MVRKVIQVLGFLYLSYLALAVLVVLPALNTLPHWYVKETFARQLHTNIILFNPFSLAVEARGARLPEADGTPFVAFRRARVNLSLESLWNRGWVLDEALLGELYVHIKQTAPGRFNFSDMLDALPPAEEPSGEDSGLPGLTIHTLTLDAQQIALTDQARETPFTTHYDKLAISVKELSTVLEEGKPYEISATAESGGQLQWKGTVSIPHSRSEGRLVLNNLSLEPIWRFAEPWLNLELQRGALSLSGDYSVNWGEAFHYDISDGELSVNSLNIVPKDSTALPDTSLGLDLLQLDSISLDSRSQHVQVGSIVLEHPTIAGWMEGQRISLQELFAVSGLESSAAEDPVEPGPPWTAVLDDAHLSNGQIHWRSQYTEPQQLLIHPLEARLKNLRWPLQGESPLELALTVNQRASLEIDGSLALKPGDGTLSYHMAELPLAWFNPNLPAALKATITDGRAGIEGRVTLAGFLPSVIQLNGAIEDFSVQIADESDSLTSWESVRLKDLIVNIDKREISLAQLMIDDYQGRVHIAEDGSVNASKVWQEEVGERAEELVEELDLDQPWKFELPEIYVSDSVIDFMDESLPIPFRTVIGDINGGILGISSAAEAEAEVDIKGSVDGYAPVVLIGTAVPFGEPPALDLSLTFNGVDLSLLTPYSGTYAGHAIDRGLLNLDLKYSLQNNQLQGDNKLMIDQLKLGEKIDSEKAVDLPLGLAIALLTDMNGVIDLAIPVSGDVNDPSFGLGSAIGKAFINLITKAVTAPFSLLANLVGADEDLQRLNFSSGSAELAEPAQAKLDQLAQALEQRPALTVIIHGRLNLQADREQLQSAALKQSVLESGVTQEQIDSRDDALLKAIEQRYRKLIPEGELPTPPKQFEIIRDSVPISDKQLLELAEARAIVIKTYLVNNSGLSADRAAIDQTTIDSKAHLFSGVELGLES